MYDWVLKVFFGMVGTHASPHMRMDPPVSHPTQGCLKGHIKSIAQGLESLLVKPFRLVLRYKPRLRGWITWKI